MDIYKIIVFSIQIRYDARKMFVMLVEVRHQRFPSVYLHSTIALVLNDVKLCQFVVSVKFSSVIHLTVDDYYLCGFGFISISV